MIGMTFCLVRLAGCRVINNGPSILYLYVIVAENYIPVVGAVVMVVAGALRANGGAYFVK